MKSQKQNSNESSTSTSSTSSMGNKKRILIFSFAYHPVIGGAEIAVKEITDRLPEYEFDMVTLRFDNSHPAEERLSNVNIHRIRSSKTLFPLDAMFYAKSLHKDHPYDAIWAIMAARAGGAALFFKYSFPKVPFILTLQEGDPVWYMKLRSLYYVNPLFRKIFSEADKVQSISNYLADYARTMGHKGEVEVIPNGVPVDKFAPKRGDTSTLRQKLGLEEGDTILITTSRLVTKNRVGDIIEALPYLPKNVKLLVLGTGPLLTDLELQVTESHLDERVKFLGHVPYEEIPHYLHVSDIFIRPSLSEGFGNSFIEAMAAGLPVIATPVGGIVDFLFDPDKCPDHPPTGLFVKVKNPESIALQVKRLLEDKNLRKELIKNGGKLVREKYEWDLIAKEMRDRVFSVL